MSDLKEWLWVCNSYDELSDEERTKISFEEFCSQNNIEIRQ